MITLIQRISDVLNNTKRFDNIGYSSRTVGEGYMMLDFDGKRYAVKLVEIPNPSENPFVDLDRVQYQL